MLLPLVFGWVQPGNSTTKWLTKRAWIGVIEREDFVVPGWESASQNCSQSAIAEHLRVDWRASTHPKVRAEAARC